MKINKKQLVGALLVFNVLVSGVILMAMSAGHFVPNEANAVTAPAAAAFDHSNCQYPDRWTNPAEGCDNSDPAVPECIKESYSQAAEKACQDTFVHANTGTAEKQQEIEAHDAPFQQPVTSCSK